MKPFATLDIETDPFQFGRKPRPFAACFFDGNVSTVYWGPSCVIDACNQALDFPGYVYAHNGGKFDLHFLLPTILQKFSSDLVEPTCIGARMAAIKTPSCEFRDSYALIPKPLKSFGNKINIDISKLENDVRGIHREEIIRYLKQDCIGLHNALLDFFERYGCDLTLASSAFKVLKKQFGVKAPSTDIFYDDNFRSFYYAGRVQFWRLGNCGGPYTICDINSAFPRAMLENHWFGSDYITLSSPPRSNRELAFYRITCDSDGILPHRGKDKSIKFPVCRNGDFFATGWELFAGIELGKIKNLRIHKVYSPQTVRSFSDYVNHFYNLKKNADNEADRNFAKLFLNAAYGKYALNPREFTDVRITKRHEPLLEAPWKHSYDDDERGLTFWQKPTHFEGANKPMRFYNVCTAASITGWVRAYLARSIDKCRGVIYCDTDSIIACDVSALEIGSEIGQWKIEKECDTVWIGGKKLYAARGFDGKYKIASKGVRLSPEQIIKVCEGQSQSYSFDAPNYSVFSPQRFTTRTVRRDDQRIRR